MKGTCVAIVLAQLITGHPIGKACDYCATFSRIGKFSYSIGKCVTIVLLLAQLVMIHLPSLAPPHFMISNFNLPVTGC